MLRSVQPHPDVGAQALPCTRFASPSVHRSVRTPNRCIGLRPRQPASSKASAKSSPVEFRQMPVPVVAPAALADQHPHGDLAGRAVAHAPLLGERADDVEPAATARRHGRCGRNRSGRTASVRHLDGQPACSVDAPGGTYVAVTHICVSPQRPAVSAGIAEVRKGSIQHRRRPNPTPRNCAIARASGAAPAPRPQGHGVRPCSTTWALPVPPPTPPPRPPLPHATEWMPSWTGPETGQWPASDALVTIEYRLNAPVYTL